MKNLVTWVEISVVDLGRAIQFYSSVLDIKIEEQNVANFSKMAFFPFDGTNVSASLLEDDNFEIHKAKNSVCAFFDVGEKLDVSLKEVKNNDGDVLTDKIKIDSGTIVYIQDSEGNRLGLFSSE
jgi:hypothetical protein